MKKMLLFLVTIALFWGMIRLSQKAKANLRRFTGREQEILNLIVLGYEDNDIAEILHTTDKTVHQYKQNILRKTHLRDISSAIEYALKRGLLSISYA